jgi:fructoselysine 6-kinase
MKTRFDVAAVGDNCIDRYLPPIGVSTVGGNALNVAVHLSRLGQSVAYFGRIGSDEDGERILARLAENGVATRHVRAGTAGPTAYTDISTDRSGDRIMLFEEFGACRGYRPDASEVAVLRSMRHVHIGWLDDGGALKQALTAAGVRVSQDLSVNAASDDVTAQSLAIAFASAGASREGARDLLAKMLREGARIAVVTCGSAGSLATDGKTHAEADVVATDVLDTLGAGDTFIAGFIAGQLGGQDLQACLKSGARAAAVTLTHYGAFPQTLVPIAS